MRRLRIIDSTTISLFPNLIVKGVGRHQKTGKKKGGIKVPTVIQANEGVSSDIGFTSAVTNDFFMLKPSSLSKGDIIAMDRAHCQSPLDNHEEKTYPILELFRISYHGKNNPDVLRGLL